VTRREGGTWAWAGRQAYQIIELGGCDAAIDTRDDLLGDGHRVDVVHVQAIAEARDACCDLVELDALLAPI
jgi:hypothetical protein